MLIAHVGIPRVILENSSCCVIVIGNLTRKSKIIGGANFEFQNSNFHQFFQIMEDRKGGIIPGPVCALLCVVVLATNARHC